MRLQITKAKADFDYTQYKQAQIKQDSFNSSEFLSVSLIISSRGKSVYDQHSIFALEKYLGIPENCNAKVATKTAEISQKAKTGSSQKSIEN